jgi:hypothetical protein
MSDYCVTVIRPRASTNKLKFDPAGDEAQLFCAACR